MTYLDFKNKSKELNAIVDLLSDKLNSFNWRNDETRISSDFQSIKSKYEEAFQKLQYFNKNASKAHKRQRSIDFRTKKN